MLFRQKKAKSHTFGRLSRKQSFRNRFSIWVESHTLFFKNGNELITDSRANQIRI